MPEARNATVANLAEPKEIAVEWMPIYVEPITHSGERLTAFLAFLPEDGKFRVVRTIHPSLLECLYGNRHGEMARLLSMVESDLTAWLASGGQLQEWSPPFSGIYPGEPVTSYDENLDIIVSQAVATTASFAKPSVVELDTSDTDISSSDAWKNSVKELATHANKAIEQRFDRTFSPSWHKKKKVHIGYVGNALAVQFVSVNPTRSVYNATNLASKKILELRSLIHGIGELHSINDLQVAVKIPQPETLSKTAVSRLEAFLADVTHYGDDVSVRVKAYISPEPVVQRIMQDVA